MADSAIASNAAEYQKVARAAAELEEQVTAYGRYKHAVAALQEAKEMLRECDGDGHLLTCNPRSSGTLMFERMMTLGYAPYGCRRPRDGRICS